jgi:hypothetical protein
MGFDELDSVLDGDDFFGGVVGNLASEFFFECHHELDGVEAVGAQIVNETGIIRNFGLIDAQVLYDDLLYPLGDIAHHTYLDRIDAQNWLCINGFRLPRPAEPGEGDVYLT